MDRGENKRKLRLKRRRSRRCTAHCFRNRVRRATATILIMYYRFAVTVRQEDRFEFIEHINFFTRK